MNNFSYTFIFFALAVCGYAFPEDAESEAVDLSAVKQLVSIQGSGGAKVHSVSGNDKFDVLSGAIRIPSKMRGDESVLGYYAIPVNTKKQAIPTACDIVVYFSYPGLNALSKVSQVRELCTKYGFTVVTAKFSGAGDQRDVNNYYTYPASGSRDVWLDLIRSVRTVGGLGNAPVFTLGWSAGGSAAQQLSSAAPGIVDAGVFIGGRTFQLEKPFLGPSLILHSDYDRAVSNEELERAVVSQLGFPPLRVAYPPNWMNRDSGETWSHYVPDSAWRLSSSWLASVANLRQRSLKTWRSNDNWPKVPSTSFVVPDMSIIPIMAAVAAPSSHSVLPTGHVISITTPRDSNPETVMWIDSRQGINRDDIICASQVLSGGQLVACSVGAGVNSDEISSLSVFGLAQQKDKTLRKVTAACLIGATQRDKDFVDAVFRNVKYKYLVTGTIPDGDLAVIESIANAYKNVVVVAKAGTFKVGLSARVIEYEAKNELAVIPTVADSIRKDLLRVLGK